MSSRESFEIGYRSDSSEITQLSHEHAKEGRIWKFALKSERDEGVFEMGSFLRDCDEIGQQRHDICVSTMAGCPLKCTMCAIPYSLQPFQRRLTRDEIFEQVRIAIKKRSEVNGRDNMSHTIGFMGNGEPFANLEEVAAAAQLLLESAERSEFRLRSMTISTTGVRSDLISGLAQHAYGTSGIGKIQYSLMSMAPARRQALIPVGGSLSECSSRLDAYAAQTGNPVKYNIALINGMNDSANEAALFAEFIGQAPHLRRAKISTFNPFPGVSFAPSSPERIQAFIQRLLDEGIEIKQFFGDIDEKVFASCGQLRARIETLLE